MELNKEILENSKQLGYELKETTEHEYDNLARSIGYEPLGYYNVYDDKSQGILVQLPDGQNRYNNGTYMYHKNKSQQHFTMIYMSRFLAHIAQIHAGDKNIREEAVNSDPYLFKMAMQGIPELDAQIEEHVKELQKANEDEDN